MRRTTFGIVVGALLVGGCGGESETLPPPAPPPPPPPMVMAPPPQTAPPPAPPPPAPTLLDLEKQEVATAYAAMTAHDAKKFSEDYTPDATLSVYGMGEAKGRDAIAENLGVLLAAFPDLVIAPGRTFVKGDVVISEWAWNGTQKGDFMGVKATGKPAGLSGVSVLWFTPEGLVKQEHRYVDGSTLMAQLGASKMPARPVPALPKEPDFRTSSGSPDEDKELDIAKPFLAAFEKKSESDFLGPLSDTVAWSDLAAPKDTAGKDEAKKFFQMFTKAFSDVKVSVDGIWAVGDYVIAESTTSGKHTGPLGPIKPTKKPVAMHGVDIMQIKDGKIVSGTSYDNSAEMLDQMGLLPKPKVKPEPAAKAKADKDAAPATADAKAEMKGDKPKATPAADPAKK